jgi:DNA-binding NarL/FixJ family response regulator
VTVKVLLVDDQELVRSGFRVLVEAEPDLEVVGEAGDGIAAVEETRRLRPDVVLMDIRMPKLDGIDATRSICDLVPDTKVVILTTYDLDQYVFAALRAGAIGFLLKDVPARQLVDAIRSVVAGGALLSPGITLRMIRQFASRPSPQRRDELLSTLTAREAEVLRLIAFGLSNQEVADHLVISEATVKTHVARILQKLGLRDRVQAVVLAYESGVVEVGAPPGKR